jgi:hypothetical protein
MKYTHTHTHTQKPYKESMRRIQNGDWDTDAECMSSMNQGPC